MEEMARVMESTAGNPNSIHREGMEARYVIERSRRAILRAINARKGDRLLFTGSATEADNLALAGVVAALRRTGVAMPVLVMPGTEHKAVLEPAKALAESSHCRMDIIEVDKFGCVPLTRSMKPSGGGADLISVCMANSELGTIADISGIGRYCRTDGKTLLHTDAAQALGRIPVDVQALGVDLATFNAHKAGGPKGIGALYVRDGVRLDPQVRGGGQEQGLRSGTEDPVSVAGFAEAVRASLENLDANMSFLRALREQCWAELSAGMGDRVVRNSPETGCLPGTLNFSVPGCDGRALVRELDARGFAVSAGSACSSGGGAEISHVLRAVGLEEERARGALRVSLGPGNDRADVSALAEALQAILRSPGP